MATELGTAYVSIVPSTKKLEAGIKQALNGVGRNGGFSIQPTVNTRALGAAGSDASRRFHDAFSADAQARAARVGQLVGTVIGRSMAVAMTGVVGLAGATLFKGFERYKSLDATAKRLQAMGKSGDQVKGILADINSVVEGTPIALDAAAKSATQFLSGGVKEGEELKKALTAIADAAGASGGNFEEIALVFGQVMNKGKLQAEEMMQLNERGINIQSALREEFHLTADELEKMSKDGTINFGMLVQAIDGKFGGMAKKMGDTVDGALGNMQTSIAKVGANFLSAIFGDPLSTTQGPGAMAEAINNITAKFNSLNSWVTSHRGEIRQFFTDATNVAKDLGTAVANVGGFLREHPGLIQGVVVAFGAWKAIEGVAALSTALKGVSTLLSVTIPGSAAVGAAGITSSLAGPLALIAALPLGVAGLFEMDRRAQIAERGEQTLGPARIGPDAPAFVPPASGDVKVAEPGPGSIFAPGAVPIMGPQKPAPTISSGGESLPLSARRRITGMFAGRYDTGGWIRDGFTMVQNKTGKPELVLNPEQTKNLSGALGAAGIDPGSIAPHMDGMRTEGYMPAVATGNTGVAGTSSLAAIFNLGNEAVGGLIDTGASMAKMAISAAATAGVGAGTMGAGAAAGPAASAAAGYGIDLAAAIAKRGVSYGFQMGSIFADAGIEQLFPFGAPRWLGYDYTSFAPQLGIQQALTTSLEKAGAAGIQGSPQGGDMSSQIAAGYAAAAGRPVSPSTMPGASQPKPPPGRNPFGASFGGGMGSSSTPTSNADIGKLLGIYDTGGELPPGMGALNLSGQPEYVLSPQQWESIQAVAPGRRGGGATYNVYATNTDEAVRELRKNERRNNLRYTARSGLGT